MSQSLYHNRKLVTIVDLSNSKTAQVIEKLKEAQKQVTAMPPKSARLLTDVTNVDVNMEVVNAVLMFAKNNTPFVKVSAAVGAEKMKNVILTNVSTAVGREIKNFNSRTEAVEWLSNQP
jgi:hypothetical protein